MKSVVFTYIQPTDYQSMTLKCKHYRLPC